MKRVATPSSTERHASVPSAEAARASSSKEGNKAARDRETSGYSPSKKLKLGPRKESAPIQLTRPPGATESTLASPVSPHREESMDVRQRTQSHATSLLNFSASPPVLRSTDQRRTTHPANETSASPSANAMPDGTSDHVAREAHPPATTNDGRRQQWQEKNQSSFIFDEITDPVVLALAEPVALASPPAASNAQQTERDQRQRLQPIAAAIKKALENDLAEVIRKFMVAGKRDDIARSEVQEAHHVFSEITQMFNRAKVAAVDGQEDRMRDELTLFQTALGNFIKDRLKKVIQHLGAEKAERDALKSGLRALLRQCGEWLHQNEAETARPWSPSNAPASPGTRQRAVSSPLKPSEAWAQAESDAADRLSLSMPGHLSPRPSQHRIGTSSPSASLTPGATSSPLASPLTSPVTSPVTNSKAVTSPKENFKSFRLSTLLSSPRSKETARLETPGKGQSRPSSFSESTGRSVLSSPQGDTAVPAKPGINEKTKKPST